MEISKQEILNAIENEPLKAGNWVKSYLAFELDWQKDIKKNYRKKTLSLGKLKLIQGGKK